MLRMRSNTSDGQWHLAEVRPHSWTLSQLARRLSSTWAFASLFSLSTCSAAWCQSQFDTHLNQVASQYLDQRAKVVAGLQTKLEAAARTHTFRDFVMKSIGGLPNDRAPLNARIVGTHHADGFDIERVVYDSLPGFHVTADLYLPQSGQRPYPAVLETPGHYPAGKLEAWSFASNMARNGIAVLSYDPIGEGERLQYFDPAINASRAGKPTGEHIEASMQIALTGDHIARYFMWDAMRGIDYLASRPEIDSHRIGAYGCSGGGAVTAYLAAFDARIKAVGTACYITGFRQLLGTIGPQEAEQTIPGFIEHGFDLADWIEAAAPVPYAVISTTEDMFPFEGARQAVEESRRVYGLYGAAERLEWISGPGRHANLRPILPQIVHFFLRRLRGVDLMPEIVDLTPPDAHALECTSTGQVATSLGGETLFSINRKAAEASFKSPPKIGSNSALTQFQDRLRQEVLTLNGLSVQMSATTPEVTVTDRSRRDGYSLERIAFSSSTGQELGGLLAVPGTTGRKHAVLMLPEHLDEKIAEQGGELERLAKAGVLVFAMELPPGGQDSEEQKSDLLGPFYLPSLRADLVGKTLVGLRVEEIVRSLDWIASRPDIDGADISAQAEGAMGIALLHAAMLDPRIRSVQFRHTLLSYRAAIDAPMPQELAQSVIPGVLAHYDLDDLMAGIAPRSIELIDPIDGEGKSVPSDQTRRTLDWVLATDRRLALAGRLKFTVSQVQASPEN